MLLGPLHQRRTAPRAIPGGRVTEADPEVPVVQEPERREDRVVSPVATRCEMTWIVMPGDCNALGTVFGGQVCAWIDICAAVSAQRFTRSNVVTAAMDQLVFKAPIRHGKIAVLQATVNWAGRTSLEVGVRVDEEDPTCGVRTHTSTGYVTFVAVDADLHKVTVPRLVPESPEELRRWREAEARRADRLAHRERIVAARGPR